MVPRTSQVQRNAIEHSLLILLWQIRLAAIGLALMLKRKILAIAPGARLHISRLADSIDPVRSSLRCWYTEPETHVDIGIWYAPSSNFSGVEDVGSSMKRRSIVVPQSTSLEIHNLPC